MDDQAIIDLYWQRSENAIVETDAKYGRLCYSLAYNVLANKEDAEESVSDTYLAAWKAIPPHRPASLTAFLSKLARRTAIDHWRSRTAEKRGGGQVPLALDELLDCASPQPDVEDAAISKEARVCLNRFLDGLPKTERIVFLRRYFLLEPIGDIGKSLGFSEGKVTSMLHRTRKKLRAHLTKEGYL